MTALSTGSPRYASASALSFCRIIAEISGGEYCLPPASTRASPPGPATTLYGTIASSSRTSDSLRPMKRLIEKTVLVGLVTAWRLATVPTRRSPDWAKATTDGVVRPPSAFSMTVGSPPSSTAMNELVVPRSIPMVLPMFENLREYEYGKVGLAANRSHQEGRKNLSLLIADPARPYLVQGGAGLDANLQACPWR